MSFEKGQSSIEYLTTYSWMLVAVSAAAGTTFGAIDVPCDRTSYGFYSDSISFENFAINENGTIVFGIKNEAYENIKIKNVSLNRENGVFRSRNVSKNVDTGGDGVVGLPGYKPSDRCNTFEIQMIYDQGPLEEQTISGEIRAPIETGKLPIPNPPSNLTVDI